MAIDGDTRTSSRWSGNGDPEELVLDLGTERDINDVQIVWHLGRGGNRSYLFELDARSQLTNEWTTIFSGMSSGATDGFENYDVDDITASVLRLRGLSNSDGTRWTGVREVTVSGPGGPVDPAAPTLSEPSPLPDNVEYFEIQSATGVGSNSRLVPSMAIDGDTRTSSRWSGNADPEELVLDLGTDRDIKDVQIVWHLGRGGDRSYMFEIDARSQLTNEWTPIFYGMSSGVTDGFENYNVDDITASVIRLRGLSNSDGTRWTGVREITVSGIAEAADEPPVDPNQLFHFGEPVDLVGANLAWSDDSRFSSDFGASDGYGNPDTNLIGFQAKFDQIVQNGGNSARIWLHTTAQVSPNIAADGRTIGLSRELTNEQVVGQLNAVLDSAWDRGILVTFNLFSFDMLCDFYESDFGYDGTMRRNRDMLTSSRQDYFDNALAPMVEGLKDHPALFAYEIFNEPEGVYTERQTFCEVSNPIDMNIAASFVNAAAATIHAGDKNVKVTTSTHTDLFNDFSNATLTSLEDADPTGTLDFYALHWYDTGWEMDPYNTPHSTYELDRPIVIGEFSVEEARAVSDVQPEDTITAILANGYAGAWPWSLATVNSPEAILGAINTSQQTPINKVAVETCIRDQLPECYKP